MPTRVERRQKDEVPPRINDRRRRNEPRMVMDQQWANGWLAFKTRGEKRRLAPFPDDWLTADESRLEDLCTAATVVHAPRRLVE